MSTLPSDRERLLRDIAAPSDGTHGREGSRARLDTLLVADLTASLGQLGSELTETRKQLADSSDAASRHQRALVRWTAVLSFATAAYAVAAFLPFFGRPVAPSASGERAWVLWEAYPGHQSEWKAIATATSRNKCEEKATQFTRSNLEQIQRSRMSSTLAYECLPDTVDPRGPKGK